MKKSNQIIFHLEKDHGEQALFSNRCSIAHSAL